MTTQTIAVDVDVKGIRELLSLSTAFKTVAGEAKDSAKALLGWDKTTKKTLGDNEKLAKGFRDLGSSGTMAGDALDALTTLSLGPLGVALAATAVVTAGVTAAFDIMSSAIQRGAKSMEDGSKRIAEAHARLETSADESSESFVGLLLDGRDLGNVYTGMAERLDTLSVAMGDNNSRANDGIRQRQTVIGQYAQLIPFVGSLNLGLTALDRIGGRVSSTVGDMSNRFGFLTSNLKGARAALGGLLSELGGKIVEGGQGVANKITDDIKAIPKRKGGGGKRRNPAEDNLQRYRGDGSGFSAGFDTFTKQRDLGFGFGAEDGADAAGIAAAMKAVADVKQAPIIEAQNRALAKQGRELTLLAAGMDATAVASGIMFRNLGKSIGGELTSGFQALTGSVSQFFGAFAAGTSTLGAFGDAMLDLFGNLSSTIGNFFIQTGTGMLFINPATGAGLIAAGIGLNALGGFLGGKGSGNKGSGSSAGAASAIANQAGPTLPRGGGGPTTIVVPITIGGHRMDPVVAAVDAAARRGAMQHVMTR